MPQTLQKRYVRVAAAITLMILLALSCSELVHWDGFHADQVDFKVYLTAAQLVREHKGVAIYNGSDTGQNPQMHFASADSIFQRTASAIGITEVRLYVYPPTLADALVPFTFFSLQHASDAWLALNIMTIVFAALLVTWMLYDTIFHIACIGFFIGILCFRANVWGFGQGQIASVLFLLWTAGIAFYAKGFKRISAAIFAIGVAIKLTPLLVLLPLLFWHEWRWIRWFALSLCVLCLSICLINGPQTLTDYVFHVMPPMSAGFLSFSNTSLPSGIQQLYLGLTGGDFQAEYAAVPKAVVFGAKLITGTVLLAAFLFIYKLGPVRSMLERAKMLSLIALLSLYCSPIAWRSAYGIVFLAALFLWRDAFKRGISRFGLFLLVVCTLEFSFFFDTILIRFAHGLLLSTTALVEPVLGCILIFYTFNQLRSEQSTPAAAFVSPGT